MPQLVISQFSYTMVGRNSQPESFCYQSSYKNFYNAFSIPGWDKSVRSDDTDGEGNGTFIARYTHNGTGAYFEQTARSGGISSVGIYDANQALIGSGAVAPTIYNSIGQMYTVTVLSIGNNYVQAYMEGSSRGVLVFCAADRVDGGLLATCPSIANSLPLNRHTSNFPSFYYRGAYGTRTFSTNSAGWLDATTNKVYLRRVLLRTDYLSDCAYCTTIENKRLWYYSPGSLSHYTRYTVAGVGAFTALSSDILLEE